MENTVRVGATIITFETKQSPRARRMRLAVFRDGRVVVTVPKRRTWVTPERFVADHAEWIAHHQASAQKRGPLIELRGTPEDFKKNKKIALEFVTQKVAEWNAHFGFSHRTISVRNARGRWGSCSRDGKLSFNYRLIYIPVELADYVVVHELAHLQEHNHGAKFWKLVASVMPDHKERRKEMRRFML